MWCWLPPPASSSAVCVYAYGVRAWDRGEGRRGDRDDRVKRSRDVGNRLTPRPSHAATRTRISDRTPSSSETRFIRTIFQPLGVCRFSMTTRTGLPEVVIISRDRRKYYFANVYYFFYWWSSKIQFFLNFEKKNVCKKKREPLKYFFFDRKYSLN